MNKILCKTCNKLFQPIRQTNIYCSGKCRSLYISRQVHPNLIENYFEKIDSKEKAYWLGFIYADGCMVRHGKSLEFVLSLSVKDENHLDKFIIHVGANILKKKYSINKNSKMVVIKIGNSIFTRHLFNSGCIFKKSHRLKFPDLIDVDLFMAFLLGFSDGDGTRTGNSSVITSCSYDFLLEIKKYFRIQNKIMVYPNFNRLALGSNLYKALIDNYDNSLYRKSIIKPDARKNNGGYRYNAGPKPKVKINI